MIVGIPLLEKLTSLAIAWLIHRQRKAAGDASTPSSFKRFVFPREVYLHPSAAIDSRFVAMLTRE